MERVVRWWGASVYSPLIASRSVSPETEIPVVYSGLTAGILLAGLFETL